MIKEGSKVFSIGTLLSLAICLPYGVAIFVSSHFSPAGFQDWDEPLYIAILQKVGSYRLQEIINFFPQTPEDFPYLPRFYAHSVVDLLLGALANITQANSLSFLFALDLISVFFAFYAFYKLFIILSSPDVARKAAVIAVGLPFIPSILEGWISIDLGKSISTEPILPFPSLPAMRGIYTQLSVPLFALCLRKSLLLFFRSSSETKILKYILAGMLCGGLIYIYAFAWISLVALVGVMGGVALIKFRNESKTTLLQFAALIAVTLLVALPGALLNLGMPAAMGMEKGVGGPFPLWLPLEYLFFISVTFYLLQTQKRGNKQVWGILFLSILVSELALGNLEFVTQSIWTPYHFSLFFFRPILSALMFIPVFERVADGDMRKLNVVLLPVLLTGLFAIHSLKASSSYQDNRVTTEIISELDRVLPFEAKLASAFYSTNFDLDYGGLIEPFYIEALTGRSIHFAQREFRAIFPEEKSPFNLLRTTLMNRGQIPTFCKANDAEIMESSPNTPIHRWNAVETSSACRKVTRQVERLCEYQNWDWFPSNLLADEPQLRKRAVMGESEVSISSLPGNRYLVGLSSAKERKIICPLNRLAQRD